MTRQQPEAALPQVYQFASPPTKNRLYIKGRVKSDAYRKWLQLAGWQITSGRVKARYPKAPVSGPVALHIEIGRNRKRDLQNHLDPICDLLQAAKVIENDRQVETLHMDWIDGVSDVRIEVWPVKS